MLDAFAGSGALGLEALSRGASHATFLETGRDARVALSANIEHLGAASRSSVIAADAFKAGRFADLPGSPFGLLFADPPYRIQPSRVADLLAQLASTGILETGAVIAYEHAARESVTWPTGFVEHARKRYGSTHVSIAVYEGLE